MEILYRLAIFLFLAAFSVMLSSSFFVRSSILKRNGQLLSAKYFLNIAAGLVVLGVGGFLSGFIALHASATVAAILGGTIIVLFFLA